MPKNYFSEEFNLYKDYINKFYPGKQFISPAELGIFEGQEKLIETQRKRLGQIADERSILKGTYYSPVSEEVYTRNVTEPVEAAHATLGMEKLKLIEGRKEQTHREALEAVYRKIEQERSQRQGFWGMVGTAIPAVPHLISGFRDLLKKDKELPNYSVDFDEIDWNDVKKMIEWMELEDMPMGGI